MDSKPYLDYLDKEMTIMGILSAVSVAAPAGILATLMGKEGLVAGLLWSSSQLFVIAGSVFCILASSLFYKERSTLAWFYGQISLIQTRGGSSVGVEELNEWLKDADSWATWWSYCCGFTLLFSGFAEYLLAMILFVVPSHSRWLVVHLHAVKLVAFFLCPIVAACSCALQTYVRIRYKYEDEVWPVFFKSLFGRNR